MNSNYRLTYKVDLVLCIDATGSMVDIMKNVKQNALKLHSDIMRRMQEKNKKVVQLRVRVITFRDYLEDGENAMRATPFFTLPDEIEKYKESVAKVEPDGGGDIPEDGLEGLAYAIRSPWEKDSLKKRHVIAVWTDAPAHPIGFASRCPAYPKGMPKSYEELSSWWGNIQHHGYMDKDAKRLVLFAPTTEEDMKSPSVWQRIAREWDNVILQPVEPGKGLNDFTYDQILDKISSTI